MTSNSPLPLDLDRAAATLNVCAVGHSIQYHETLPSTMPVAHTLALRPDIRSGAVVLAGQQTAGRGRMQRRWESLPGRSLLLSVLLRKNQLPEQVLQLPMIAGLAVLRSVISTGVPRGRVGLKWPNDLVIGDSWENARKVAGVLIESSSQGAETSYAVVGVGVNANHSVEDLPQIEPPSLPPTSLALELGEVVDCTDLLIAFCRNMADLLTLPSPMLAAAWSSALWNLHRQVTVTLPEGSHLSGTALGVNEQGSLIVEHDGRTTIVSAGDVSIRTSG